MSKCLNLLIKFVLVLVTSNLIASEYYRAMVNPEPSEIPSRIALNWSDDPTTSISVTWRTSTNIENAYAEIAIADDSANFITWRTQVIAKTEKWNQGKYGAHFHSVTFSKLKPDTLYAYRVG